MQAVKPQPKITQELVDWLSQRFYYELPSPGTSIEQVMYQSGQMSVIQFLQANIKQSTTDQFNNREV